MLKNWLISMTGSQKFWKFWKFWKFLYVLKLDIWSQKPLGEDQRSHKSKSKHEICLIQAFYHKFQTCLFYILGRLYFTLIFKFLFHTDKTEKFNHLLICYYYWSTNMILISYLIELKIKTKIYLIFIQSRGSSNAHETFFQFIYFFTWF